MLCNQQGKAPGIAITGATGFIGRRLLADCRAAGLSVAALTRQDQTPEPGINWVQGDLFTPQALAELVDGADHVIHLAGATKALTTEGFTQINTDATAQLARICVEGGVRNFTFLSSLAATRPAVSPYAASKAQAEAAISAYEADINITTIRAPAVLGPGDSATYPLFSNLARGILPVPGGPARNARFSIIDVADLTALLLAGLRDNNDGARLITPYGHESLGWQDVADSAARVLGRRVRQITVPSGVMSSIAWISDRVAGLTGKPQVFSGHKLREMRSGDWIGTDRVNDPHPLDETMKRCLAPFQKRSVPVT